VAKHLIDLDEDAVSDAPAEDTVNEACPGPGPPAQRVSSALDVLARLPETDRDDAWR
jgi:hypothetical protein